MEELNRNDSSDRGSDNKAVRGQPGFLDKLISTGLGSGLSPIAPGTVGSLLALLVYSIPGFERLYVIIPSIVIFFAWGTYSADRMEVAYGHDPSRVVIDEVVGMWISLLFLPKRLVLGIIAFLLFRILDIIKPWPASWFDKRSRGISIVMDDVVCGVYANVLLQLYLYFGR